MDDYVSKPVQVGELVAALNKCRPRPVAERAQLGSPVHMRPVTDAHGAPGPPFEAARQKANGETTAEVLDPAALKRLRATLGKQADAMLPALIASFHGDALKLISEARRALAAGKDADLRRAAHSLKSTSATFGVMALSAAARQLETLAKDGVLDGAAELIERAEAEYARAREALEAARGGALK